MPPACPSIPGFTSGHPRIIPGWTAIYPPCPNIPGFQRNLCIPGLSHDGHPYAPLVQASRDSQVTWPSRDYPRMHSHLPPCPSIPGFTSNLAIPGLSQDGQPYTVIPLVQVSQDCQVTWPSQDYHWMDSHIPPLSKYPGIPK